MFKVHYLRHGFRNLWSSNTFNLDHIIKVSKVSYSLDQLTTSFAHWSFRTLEFVVQKVKSCTVTVCNLTGYN